MQSPFAGIRGVMPETTKTVEIVVAPEVIGAQSPSVKTVELGPEPTAVQITIYWTALPVTGFGRANSQQVSLTTHPLKAGWETDLDLNVTESQALNASVNAARDKFAKATEGKATFGAQVQRDTVRLVTRVDFYTPEEKEVAA